MPLITISIPPGYSIVAGKAQLRKVLRAAGAEVSARARAMIRQGGATKKRTAKRKSVAGQPPVSRSGTLAKSIKVRPWKSGEGVSIRDTAFYALFLEKGAKGGGGNTHNRANILLAGERNWRGKLLRSQNRMKRSAISKTRVLLAHPFLVPALDQVVKGGLADRVREAVMSGLAFQKGKPVS
jgi:hypothetical protein